MPKIYLDYAATTPVDPKVMKEMLPYFTEKFGNPMSMHSFGQEASVAVEKARAQVADFLHATSQEIVFTSGATESNNLAIKGVLEAYFSNPKNTQKPHIITSSFEHHCVLTAVQEAERKDLAEVTFIQPEKDGVVSLKKIEEAISPNTILISIMYVNNEIGTVQPIEKIGKLVKKVNQKRKTTRLDSRKQLVDSPRSGGAGARRANYKLLLHTDATQAVNYFDCNVERLGVDMLSLSGHKIYGPKGIGALYVKAGTSIRSIQHGGEQESGKRAGTHNVPGIIGLGKAISMIDGKDGEKILKLRNYLIDRILKEIPDTRLNGSRTKRSPNNVNISFKDIEGESLILSLDMEGIACSTGSACSSGSLEPSHVLMSLGMKAEEAHGSLRMTLGKYTTRKEIDYTVKKLKTICQKLRTISGNVLEEFYENNK